MLTDFGRKARAYRLRHDMLLYDMALIMRLGTAQLSGYECGRAEPPADVVESLDTLIRVENNLPYAGADRGAERRNKRNIRSVEDVEMKCICGYEQNKPFEQYKNFVPSGMMRNIYTVGRTKSVYLP